MIDPAKALALMESGVRRVYLGGPMTGIPQFNFPAFDAAAKELRAAGFEVVSPAELDDPETRKQALGSDDGAIERMEEAGHTWESFLARDILLLARPELHAGIFLPGWTRSRGANFEAAILKSLAKPVLRYPTFAPVRHKPRLPYQTEEENNGN